MPACATWLHLQMSEYSGAEGDVDGQTWRDDTGTSDIPRVIRNNPADEPKP
jgi:hypothetical protein